MLELKGDSAKEAPAPAPAPSSSDTEAEKRKPLRCRECGHGITWEDARTSVDGEHEHMRVNPAAFVYRFGCFRDADGAKVSGEPTEAHTWFDGCRWQYAHCGKCAAHLGWFFTGAQSFFGLLLDFLISEA